MARTTIDLDETVLAEAARELGTPSEVDTVNAALAFVASRQRRAAMFDDALIWGSRDLTQPEVRESARR